MLASIDAWMRFDWVAWADFVRSHPALNEILQNAYSSHRVQIFGSLLVFALARALGRNAELLTNALVALLITCFVFALFPALGPWVHFSYPVQHAADTAYVADILAVRRGVPLVLSVPEMHGIVCFPSYHTVLAILLVYAHRGMRWTLPLMLVTNGLMLLSIPSEGGHYLVDMIGGAVVALCAIGITKHLRAWLNCSGLVRPQ